MKLEGRKIAILIAQRRTEEPELAKGKHDVRAENA